MKEMLRLELLGVLLLSCTQILTEHHNFDGPRNRYSYRTTRGTFHNIKTREVQVKYGRLRGIIIDPRIHNLQLVDVFLGVPYAEPPIGTHRFEPPTTQTPWTGVRHFDSFAPVCPQVLPNTEEEIDTIRHRYLKRLLPFLQNQSEDCLYLNIYAPHQNNSQRNKLERFPVMVFIHGESYEWNSGNPYDGTVLAAYGSVVFVTVNFRLGILGFLRPGTKDDTASNFGLLDQIAALAWLKDNIGQFGGDPERITLLGHGTGAVFVNLLLLSPIDGLFKRAILMSGSALNPDAIGKAPLQITKQVAYALNCPQINDEELVTCFKSRHLNDLLNVKIHKPKYVPAFAPLIDLAVIPDKPLNLMKNVERLAKFDLMYGVTQLEKFHILPGVALLEGLSDSSRDEFIRDSVKATHELEPELILRKVLEHYEEKKLYKTHRSRINDKYEWNRDITLEVISDSGVVAPIISLGNLHSRVNPKSYMYVFSHQRSIRDSDIGDFNQQIRYTVHGEELPYVLGIPLDGKGYHLSAPYDNGEALLSKAIMDWWCNFAYYGNPNSNRLSLRQSSHLRDNYKSSLSYQTEWPEYDSENQAYFNLMIPPQINHHYRISEMEFWNEVIPYLLRRPKGELAIFHDKTTRRPRPEHFDISDRKNNNETAAVSVNSQNSHNKTNHEVEAPLNLGNKNINKINEFNEKENSSEGTLKNNSAVSLVIVFGIVFLLINTIALVYLYHKRQRMRSKAFSTSNRLHQMLNQLPENIHNDRNSGNMLQNSATLMKRSKSGKAEQHRELGYCSSSSKPDIHELIKNDKAYDNNSNFGRTSRENRSSTIDTKIKVREWIQQEIVHRCSPRFLRKTRETLQREHHEKIMKQECHEKHGTNNECKNVQSDNEELYKENHQICVRPSCNTPKTGEKVSKVSVAVDATPSALTDSVLNQIPIELIRTGASSEYLDLFEDMNTTLEASMYCEPTDFHPNVINQFNTDEAWKEGNIVVIEHHHSKSDPLPLDKIHNCHVEKIIPSTARINESDSGSTSSLYAKINPRMKSRLPVHQYILQKQLEQQESSDLKINEQPIAVEGISKTLPRLLTFSSPFRNPSSNPNDINVTSREENIAVPTISTTSTTDSHEEALRTIRRRNYPKVLPDIEKRRSLPPNASFVEGTTRYHNNYHNYRQGSTAPSPPPRTYSTSRSLDFVEDNDEEDDEDSNRITMTPVTTNLHVGPLRKKTDSLKNQSVPSLADNSDTVQLSSSVSLPICPIHSSSKELLAPGAKSEPRIVITPRIETGQELQFKGIETTVAGVDQIDHPRRMVPERSIKQPRIIIKPTTTTAGTLPRSNSNVRMNKPIVSGITSTNLHKNETYQRLLARREKMPLPNEISVNRIPPCDLRRDVPQVEQLERAEIIRRINMNNATVTKL